MRMGSGMGGLLFSMIALSDVSTIAPIATNLPKESLASTNLISSFLQS